MPPGFGPDPIGDEREGPLPVEGDTTTLEFTALLTSEPIVLELGSGTGRFSLQFDGLALAATPVDRPGGVYIRAIPTMMLNLAGKDETTATPGHNPEQSSGSCSHARARRNV